MRDGLTVHLIKNGFAEVVCSVADGVAYEQACAGMPAPDLAIVDLNMDGRDGWETLAWIKEHQPGTRTIAITFDPKDDAVCRAVSCGACTVLPKERADNTLLAAVKDVMRDGYHHNEYMQRQMGYRPAADSPAALRKRLEDSLSPRELVFLTHYVDERNRTPQDVADNMHISKHTAETNRKRVVEKLGVSKRPQLIALARRFHLLPNA